MKKTLLELLILSNSFFFILQNSQCMEDQHRKNIITIDHSVEYNTKNSKACNDSFAHFMRREASFDPLRTQMRIPYASPLSTEQQKQLHEALKIKNQHVHYANILSTAAQIPSAKSILSIPNLTFSIPGLTQDLTQRNANLQNTINQTMYVFCKPDGSLKASLTEQDHYQIARLVTNYLKKEMPHDYKGIITRFAQEGKPGFQTVSKEESLWRFKGSPYVTSSNYPQDPIAMRQRVLENPHNQECTRVIQLCESQQLEKAKYIVDCYKNHVMYDSASPQDDYVTISKLYEEFANEYCTKHILKPLNIPANPEIMGLLHEVIPHAASNQPLKVMDTISTVLTERQADCAYYEAIKPLFDQRGLPRFYNFDDHLFEDITIPSSITNVEHLKERILLFKVATSASQGDLDALQAHRNAVGYIAQACTEQEKRTHYLELAAATIDALQSKSDTTILQCNNLLAQSNEALAKIQHRVMLAELNLIDEINNLKMQKAPAKFIKDNQELLLTLDKQFQALDGTVEKQTALNTTLEKIIQQLQVFSRPEMRKTPSQKLLEALQFVDVQITDKTRSYDVDYFKKTIGTLEQKSLKCEMLYHQRLMTELQDKISHSSLNSDQCKELFTFYNDMMNEAIQLNDDSRITLAKSVYAVAKDTFSILLSRNDFPLQEIKEYAQQIFSNPGEYIVNTLKGFVQLIHVAVDYTEHNSTLSTPEQRMEYSQKVNDAVHKFLNTWQRMDHQQKKEFVAKLLVNSITSKAIGNGINAFTDRVGR